MNAHDLLIRTKCNYCGNYFNTYKTFKNPKDPDKVCGSKCYFNSKITYREELLR